MNFYKQMAELIPASIIKTILAGEIIEKAINTEVTDTPMEYLFDVYEEFIDTRGEFDNWFCYKCRQSILLNWREMKKFLIEINEK
jgi:hypothetical protein